MRQPLFAATSPPPGFIASRAGAVLSALDIMSRTQVLAGSNLPANYLGQARGSTIVIDATAADRGWFVDPTPAQDEEFTPRTPNSGRLAAIDRCAVGRIDLLTVVEHELGHIAGLQDRDPSASSLMSGLLGAGVRSTAGPADAAAILANGTLQEGSSGNSFPQRRARKLEGCLSCAQRVVRRASRGSSVLVDAGFCSNTGQTIFRRS